MPQKAIPQRITIFFQQGCHFLTSPLTMEFLGNLVGIHGLGYQRAGERWAILKLLPHSLTAWGLLGGMLLGLRWFWNQEMGPLTPVRFLWAAVAFGVSYFLCLAYVNTAVLRWALRRKEALGEDPFKAVRSALETLSTAPPVLTSRGRDPHQAYFKALNLLSRHSIYVQAFDLSPLQGILSLDDFHLRRQGVFTSGAITSHQVRRIKCGWARERAIDRLAQELSGRRGPSGRARRAEPRDEASGRGLGCLLRSVRLRFLRFRWRNDGLPQAFLLLQEVSLKDPAPAIRDLALTTLDPCGLGMPGQVFLAALGDEGISVRAVAALALARRGHPEGTGVLYEMVEDYWCPWRADALHYLALLDPERANWLRGRIEKGEIWEIRPLPISYREMIASWMATVAAKERSYPRPYLPATTTPVSPPRAEAEKLQPAVAIFYDVGPETIGALNTTVVDSVSNSVRETLPATGSFPSWQLSISGYDADPRGLWGIREVRRWCQAAQHRAPYLPCLLAKDSVGWYLFALMQTTVLGRGSTSLPPEEEALLEAQLSRRNPQEREAVRQSHTGLEYSLFEPRDLLQLLREVLEAGREFFSCLGLFSAQVTLQTQLARGRIFTELAEWLREEDLKLLDRLVTG